MSQMSPLGPIPSGADPEHYDRLRRRTLWRLSTGLYLLGTRAGDRRNLMTCNWVTQVATQPKLVAVGVERGAFSHELLAEGRVFAIALLARDDRAVVRHFVKPATDDQVAHTLNEVPYLDTPITGAPVPRTAIGWLDCTLNTSVDAISHTLFIGEVVDVGEVPGGEKRAMLRMEDTKMSYGG
jgi:flavin reductase (DIM6/NTAB) family NADH-FMN oxidoreductase RutF